MNKIILSLLILCTFSIADTCSDYKCTKKPNKDFHYTQSDYHCTLPNMPNLKIVAEDVFEADDVTLKTYPWEAGRNVCDVLGWMNIPFKANKTFILCR